MALQMVFLHCHMLWMMRPDALQSVLHISRYVHLTHSFIISSQENVVIPESTELATLEALFVTSWLNHHHDAKLKSTATH